MEISELTILAIDDNRDNLTSLKAVVLDRLPGTRVLTALNGSQGLDLARTEDPDVILLDVVMPGLDGYTVCRKMKESERLKTIPILFLTALKTDRESRVRALEAGAEGFLSKPFDEVELTAQIRAMAKVKAANRHQRMEMEQLAGLVSERTRDLERELSVRRRAEEALRESEEKYRLLAETSRDIILLHDLDGRIVYVNQTGLDFTGLDRAEVIGRDIAAFIPPDQLESLKARQDQRTVGDERGRRYETEFVGREGRRITVDVHSTPIRREGRVTHFLIIGRDVTERKRAEEALSRVAREWQTTFDAANDAIWLLDKEQRIVRFNKVAERFFRCPEGTFAGKHCWEIVHGTTGPIPECPHRKMKANLRRATLELRIEDRWFEATVDPILDAAGAYSGSVHIFNDITERKKAEQERERLQAQFLQAQKMESVGRLAGGVAHDFNNMLSVILGYTDLALMKIDAGHLLFGDLREIRKAAGRSADLTRQLLAFARKQTIAPKALDLNETVSGMLKMLKRLIGEDIDLVWRPGPDLWTIRMDPSQIDQILANLCVNARDAIAGVGRVTIETENVVIDEDYSAALSGLVSGEYIRLMVSDNGCGMNKETIANVFEPFFTTKGAGRGTGLGLATVYGIARQNNGFVNVYSEPGQGAVFRLYLPRHAVEITSSPAKSQAEMIPRGRETILLVEDEPAILNMTARMLERLGYQVLAAVTPGEAEHLARTHPNGIHLLITDVVMPEMNGWELAQKLLTLRPGLHHLFMSGYTANVIAHHGVLDEGVKFIPKPFTMQALAAKVREALNSHGEKQA
jgi:PAS domain S-box-containing protein